MKVSVQTKLLEVYLFNLLVLSYIFMRKGNLNQPKVKQKQHDWYKHRQKNTVKWMKPKPN